MMRYGFLCIALTALFILTACTPAADTISDTAAETVTDAVTVTDSETEEIKPEPLDLAEKIDFDLKPVYREKETTSDGSVKISGIRAEVSYTSTFYGARSAIRRPYTSFAQSFVEKTFGGSDADFKGQLAAADMDGDGFDDLIVYDDGVISVYKTNSTFKKETTYTFDTNNKYTVGQLFTAEIGKDAKLCGAGDFNGDGYNDLLFYKNGNTVIYEGGESGFALNSFILPDDTEGSRLCGDVDGDGLCDIVILKDGKAAVYVSDGEGFKKSCENPVNQLPQSYEYALCADFNCDKRADLAFIEKTEESYKITSVFGLGDGTFGTDKDNKNLYSVFEFDKRSYPENVTVGDFTGNGAADLAGYGSVKGKKLNAVYCGAGEPAYDYSLFGMKVNGEYRLYSGCRWADANTGGDGDHVMLSISKDGKNWQRNIEAPMFFLGWEIGEEDAWWRDNTLEPEVIFADGKYHMYWQCSYVTPKGNYGDKIGYASSSDGVNWERKTDEPAIICSDPEIGFNHEEVIYVADDPDGKQFWMYTGHFVNGTFRGYIRIRSSDPERFDYSDAESTSGFSQIGNQIAYLTDKDGGKLFMRITFTDSGKGYTVPTLQFSRDGLRFDGSGKLQLAGVDQDDPRNAPVKNVYFLGLATENGTGEIKQNDDGTYTFMYFATTCATSVAPEIFGAEGGYGIATLTIG